MQLFNNIWLTPCYHPSNPLMNKDPPGWCLLTAGLLSPVKSLVNPLPPASCSPCHGPAGSPGYWEICLNISDGNQNIRKCKESFSWRVFKIWGSITRIRPRLYKCHINTLNHLGSIMRRKDSPEYNILERQIAIKEKNSRSWAIYAKSLLKKYSLPRISTMLYNTPPLK